MRLRAALVVLAAGIAGCGSQSRPGTRTTTKSGPSMAQRALATQLHGLKGAGVVVDVGGGRLLAAAGSGGRSPWRSLQAPGMAIAPVLAAGALDGKLVTPSTRLRGGATLGEALRRGDAAAIADVAVRIDGWSIDELMRRVGFDARPRAGDLRTLVRVSRGPQMTPEGTHGVGSAPSFYDADGRYRDPGARARATTFELGQLALALASDGRRIDVGRHRPGPEPIQPPWSTAAGAKVRRMITAGSRVAVATGTVGPAVSLVAFAPAAHPRVAVALTAVGGSSAAALSRRGRRLLGALIRMRG